MEGHVRAICWILVELWPRAEAYMGQHCWRLRQLWAEGGRQLVSGKLLGYSWASGVAGQNEPGQTDMGWPPGHLPSVCLSLAWEQQNTVLFKYLRAFFRAGD